MIENAPRLRGRLAWKMIYLLRFACGAAGTKLNHPALTLRGM
jgi:hypothetical protein